VDDADTYYGEWNAKVSEVAGATKCPGQCL
jgi:hypothetical protein